MDGGFIRKAAGLHFPIDGLGDSARGPLRQIRLRTKHSRIKGSASRKARRLTDAAPSASSLVSCLEPLRKGQYDLICLTSAEPGVCTEFLCSQRDKSVVQYDAQKRRVDLKAAIVLDETKFPELVHKEINASACCTDHLRQHFLRNFRQYSVELVFFAVAGQQQKTACSTMPV